MWPSVVKTHCESSLCKGFDSSKRRYRYWRLRELTVQDRQPKAWHYLEGLRKHEGLHAVARRIRTKVFDARESTSYLCSTADIRKYSCCTAHSISTQCHGTCTQYTYRRHLGRMGLVSPDGLSVALCVSTHLDLPGRDTKSTRQTLSESSS